MHLSMFSPRGQWDSHGDLDNFEKLGSNFPSMRKYVLSKIPNLLYYKMIWNYR